MIAGKFSENNLLPQDVEDLAAEVEKLLRVSGSGSSSMHGNVH